MTAKPSFPASAKPAAPKSISPTLTGRKRSKPSARFPVPCSFDVLYLLAQFFNLRLDFEPEPGNRQCLIFHARRFRKHRVRFAMHFLQKKIELFAEFARPIQQFPELLKVAAQAVQLFADVAALSQNCGFLRDARRINRRAAQQFLQAYVEPPGKSRAQRR